MVGGGLAAAASLAGLLRLRAAETPPGNRISLEQLIPQRIGPWTDTPFSGVLIPQGEKAEERSYDDVLTRYYAGAAGGVMLLVAYGGAQAGDTELHRPEVCYPAAGFRLSRWPNVLLRFPRVDISAASMTAAAPERIEQLLYWSRIGPDFPTSSLAQRWSILRQSVRGAVPDGVLVRMSTISADREAALQTLGRFAADLLSAGGPSLRRLLTGET